MKKTILCILCALLLAGCASEVAPQNDTPKIDTVSVETKTEYTATQNITPAETSDESSVSDISTEQAPATEVTDTRRVVTEKDFPEPEYGWFSVEEMIYTAYTSDCMPVLGVLDQALWLLEGEDVLYRVVLLIGGDFADRTVETEEDLQNQLAHLDMLGVAYSAIEYSDLRALCEANRMYETPFESNVASPVNPRWAYTADLSREDMEYLRKQGGFACVSFLPVIEPEGEGKLDGWLVEELVNADAETLIGTEITLTTDGFEKPSVIGFDEMQRRIKDKLGWNPDSIRGQGGGSDLTHEEVDAYYELLIAYYRLSYHKVKDAFLQEFQTEIDGMLDGRGAYIDGYKLIVELTADEILFLETLEKVESISLVTEYRTANIKRLMALPDREWDDRFGVMPYDARIERIETYRQEYEAFFG